MTVFLTRINPAYKAAFVTAAAILLSFTYSIQLNCWIFFASMLLIAAGSKKILAALRFLLPAGFCAAGFLITGLFFGGSSGSGELISVSSLDTGLNLASRVLAFAGLGMLFSLTTEPVSFVQSLRRAGLPRKFAYGLLCAFHLLPAIKREYENACLAVRIRGVRLNPFSIKPVFSTLANCIRWSDSLSMAMQSKGFEE